HSPAELHVSVVQGLESSHCESDTQADPASAVSVGMPLVWRPQPEKNAKDPPRTTATATRGRRNAWRAAGEGVGAIIVRPRQERPARPARVDGAMIADLKPVCGNFLYRPPESPGERRAAAARAGTGSAPRRRGAVDGGVAARRAIPPQIEPHDAPAQRPPARRGHRRERPLHPPD